MSLGKSKIPNMQFLYYMITIMCALKLQPATHNLQPATCKLDIFDVLILERSDKSLISLDMLGIALLTGHFDLLKGTACVSPFTHVLNRSSCQLKRNIRAI